MPKENSDLKYDYDFDEAAQNNTAAAIYRFVQDRGPRILDLGSGPAIVSSRFSKVDGSYIACADMDTAALQAALEAGVDSIYTVDLDKENWHAAIPDGSFDCIIIADVLEHVRNPARLLQDILERKFLAPGGRLVISIPNANHQAVVGSLLAGDFAYTETGILDSTHVRWFTLNSLTRMLEENGFAIERIHRTTRSLEQTQQSSYLLSLSLAARQALDDMGVEGKTLQYVVEVTLRGESHAAPSQAIVDSIRTEFDEKSKLGLLDLRKRLELAHLDKGAVEDRVKELEAELDRTKAVNAKSGLQFASLAALIEEERSTSFRELESLSKDLAAHRRNASRLRAQVNEVTGSASWRIARALILASHPVSSGKKIISRLKPSQRKK